MIRLVLPGAQVTGLRKFADLRHEAARQLTAPTQAARWRRLADQLGDALDQLPQPIPFREDPTA